LRWRTLPTKFNIWREKPALDEKIVQAQRSSRQRKREEGRLVVALFFGQHDIRPQSDSAAHMFLAPTNRMFCFYRCYKEIPNFI